MRMPPWPADATMARWLRALPRLAAVLAVTVGAMALAGWALRLPLLTRLAPALPAMVPNTAVAFVLAGAALWLLAPEGASRWPRRVGHGLALLVVLFGVAVLGACLWGWRWCCWTPTGVGATGPRWCWCRCRPRSRSSRCWATSTRSATCTRWRPGPGWRCRPRPPS